MNINLIEEDIKQLENILAELPHKYAVGLINFFNSKIKKTEEVVNEG